MTLLDRPGLRQIGGGNVAQHACLRMRMECNRGRAGITLGRQTDNVLLCLLAVLLSSKATAVVLRPSGFSPTVLT